MKNKLAIRLVAACACTVVLLTASFSQTGQTNQPPPVVQCQQNRNRLENQINNNLAKLLPCPIRPIRVEVTNLSGSRADVTLRGEVPSGAVVKDKEMSYAQWVKAIVEAAAICGTVTEANIDASRLRETPVVEATVSCSGLTKRKLKDFVEDRLDSKTVCEATKFKVEVEGTDSGKIRLRIRNCPNCPDSVRKIVDDALASLGGCVENITPPKPPPPPPCPDCLPGISCASGFIQCQDVGGNVACIEGRKCPNTN